MNKEALNICSRCGYPIITGKTKVVSQVPLLMEIYYEHSTTHQDEYCSRRYLYWPIANIDPPIKIA